MEKLGMEKGEPIEHNLISKAIENAQSKVEGHNFDIRKQLLEYDDVMNQQREVIYRQRREALAGKDLKTSIEDMIMEKAEEIADLFADERTLPEDWDIKGLDEAVFKQFNFRLDGLQKEIPEKLNGDGLAQLIYESAMEVFKEKEAVIGAEDFRNLERIIMLQTVDSLWKDHLLSMDHLKEGIGLRGYAQQNPLIVYKKEGFEMFQDMIARIKEEVVGILFRIQIAEPEKIDILKQPQEQDLVFSGADDTGETKKKPVKRTDKKIGRNAPCPCGSGKKYKKCCGA
jgi:preprotein translocase subunit SecA